MSGFEYEVTSAGLDDPSGANKWRQYVALNGPTVGKSGVFTIPKTLPSGSYPSVTGLGFRPEGLFLCTTVYLNNTEPDDMKFWVGATARGKQWGVSNQHPNLDSFMPRGSRLSTAQILQGVAEFSSFDDDGFTLNLPNQLNWDLGVAYWAIGGVPDLGMTYGGFDAGTNLSPASSGTQSITTPFAPTAVFFCTVQVRNVDVLDKTWAVMTFGAGDNVGNFASWAGARQGYGFTQQGNRTGKAVGSYELAGWISGIFRPSPLSEASVTLTPTGFDLNWTVNDGIQRYFSWVAFRDAEVGRFVYNHSGLFETGFVPTRATPTAELFFMNDAGWGGMYLDGSPGRIDGASLAIGFCGTDLSSQHLGTWSDVDNPPFGFPMNGAETASHAFGCWEAASGGFSGAQTRDTGDIIAVEGSRLIPMNWRQAVRKPNADRVLTGRGA